MSQIYETNIAHLIFNQDNDSDDDLYSDSAIKSLLDTPVHDVDSANDFFSSLNKPNTSSFSILNLNIRSLGKNITKLQFLIHKLKWEFNVICLQETWSKYETNDLMTIDLPGYNLVTLPRGHSRRGGGLGLYIKNDLLFKLRKDLTCSDEDVEILTIELLRQNEKNMLLSNIYRPPKGTIVYYQERIAKHLHEVNREGKSIYIAGDFNLNLLDYETEVKVRDFVNLMCEYLLLPSINKPTRIALNKSSCIDNIFVPYSHQQELYAGVITEKISDHLPQFLIVLSFPLLKTNERFCIKKRTITPEKISVMKDRLTHISWTSVTSNVDVSDAYAAFVNEFSDLYDELFPSKEIIVKTKTIINKWMNKELIKMSRKKQKLYNKFLKCRTYMSEAKYKQCKRQFERRMQITKKNYYSKLLIKHQYNLRKTWNILKDVIDHTNA